MKGVRRPAIIFAILSAIYWNGVSSFNAMLFTQVGKDIAPFWAVGLSAFIPTGIYAVFCLLFFHWFARRMFKQAKESSI